MFNEQIIDIIKTGRISPITRDNKEKYIGQPMAMITLGLIGKMKVIENKINKMTTRVRASRFSWGT